MRNEGGVTVTNRSAHFIGIGGIGMSALTRWFLAQKWRVSGSDLAKSKITRELAKEGVKLKIRQKKARLGRQLGLVIYSQAIKSSNSELRMARRLRLASLSYPEAVGRLTEKYKTVAIAGAHGKSTTTALTALILKKAGFDPTVIVGTNLKEFGGKNFLSGKGPYLVLEADEFGRAFLHYSPALAVVTNIDKEHLDTYKNLTAVKNAFLKFLLRVKPGGALILNQDDKNLFSLKLRIKKIAKSKNLKVVWYSVLRNNRTTNIIQQLLYNRSKFATSPAHFSFGRRTAERIRKIIRIPGEHNVSNAAAAYAVGRVLKIPENRILGAISKYRGSWRRMEYRGLLKAKSSKLKARVYDDYAHHPTEIKATLAAFREKFPKSKIVCVFQPHQAKRLQALFREFVTAFNDADITVLIPFYKVAGRDRMDSRFTSQTLAAAIQKKYPAKQVFYLANPRKLKQFITKILRRSAYSPRQSALVVMMGAGDIVNYTDTLVRNSA
jgi:UDP-N-acetylmuramate--alanine ligase